MGIFCFNVHNQLTNIFDNEQDKNNSYLITAPDGCYTYVTVSDEDYNNVKNELKYVQEKSGDTIIYGDQQAYYEDSNDLKAHVNIVTESIDEWFKSVPNHPNKDSWVTYKEALKNINYSSITFPAEKILLRFVVI